MADEFGQRITGVHAIGDTPLSTDKHMAALALDNSGDYAYLTLDSNGALLATGGTEYAVSDVAGLTDKGALTLVVRDDVLTTLTPADGDYTALRVNSEGALWVDIGASELAVTQSGVWDIGTVGTITNDVNIADGGNSITVDAVELDIRPLNNTDVITVEQGTNPWTVDGDVGITGTVDVTQSGTWDIGTVTDVTTVATVTDVTTVGTITNDVNIADGGNSITVDAVDLDVRDLSSATDNVEIKTAAGQALAIESDGSINVNAQIGAADSTYAYAGVNLVKDTETTVVSEAPGADTQYTGLMVSGAGYCEWTLKFGTTSSEAIIMKFWTTPSHPTQYVDLPDYLTVSSGETILVTGTNREKKGSPHSDFIGHASLVNKA